MATQKVRPDGIGKLEVAEGPGAAMFSIAVVAMTAIFLAATLGANIIVDPRAEFDSDRFVPLVPDWPMAKLQGYQDLEPAPRILILGTSRGMDVPAPSGLENQTFNFAFPGGEVPAVELLLDYVQRSGHPPERIVYLVDQFALRKDILHKIRDSDVYPLISPDGGDPVPLVERLGKFPAALSLGYVQDTVRVLAYTYGSADAPSGPRFDRYGQLDHAALEGRLVSGQLDQAAAIEDILTRVLQPTFAEGRGVDGPTREQFQALVEATTQAGIAIDIVFPPFHPDALPRVRAMPTFEEHYRELLETSAAACGPSVRVYDFTDPASFGAVPVYFSDAYHMTPSNGRRLIDAVEAGAGNLCAA